MQMSDVNTYWLRPKPYLEEQGRLIQWNSSNIFLKSGEQWDKGMLEPGT